MSRIDLDKLASDFFQGMEVYVQRAISPLVDRLNGVAEAVKGTPTEADIKRIVAGAVSEKSQILEFPGHLTEKMAEIARAEFASAVAALPTPKDGKDADPEVIKALVDEAVSAIPKPRDGDPGKSVTADELTPVIDELVAKAVAVLPPAAPGKDADPDSVAALVKETVESTLGAWPRPRDGESVTLEQVAPLVTDAVAKAVARLPAPKDGVGMAGALIDRDKHLIVTLTNGEHKDLGPVVGKDGDPGNDGLGFDDLEMIHDGERGFTFRMMRGEKVKEFAFTVPAMIYRGVFKEQDYAKGDAITWGGSLWHCNENTKENPDQNHTAWTLVAKKGRDGKDGIVKPTKDPAPVKI